ncbi:Putative hydrolase of the alpha/beta superfamily [Candidatus Glomeribacter gigasporarum BEG34]|uniref:Putative hydrolase of the alpha/beta superfamily n=1 Tax=Candidatus Glomeribacter gigasporarum BEG34 TaxID=1070319 RepID=G2JB22_9BURK|nr:alpha/beta hydrolase [Candidatus Glomeribacter gigasporarum]CCD29974.1 Putative hydrolase of the alpha/beta superfamily [Candidatus Glomeribacter gigasporarum BEG34]
MNTHTEKYLLDGPAGKIEIAVEDTEAPRQGIGLVAHPHPLLGGTMDNKVVHTLTRAFVRLGYRMFRANFRGVGQSEGEHDHGRGEQDDLLTVIEHMRAQPACAQLPLILAGFSFGAFVLSHVAQRLAQQGMAAQRLVFVGTATSRWKVANVPENTLVIHGERDDVVPLSSVYDWARPQELPVIVVPDAGHFFHRKLHVLKRIITDYWHAPKVSS